MSDATAARGDYSGTGTNPKVSRTAKSEQMQAERGDKFVDASIVELQHRWRLENVQKGRAG